MSLIESIKLLFLRKEKFCGLSYANLGFIPKNKGLYRLALLHKSASTTTKGGQVLNYERLEFLGDAVIGAIVAELLYKFFPNQDEGFLTRVRSNVVSRESLNELAINIGLNKSVVSRSDLSKNKHVYGDVFEAFMGAMFLDQGFLKSKRFIEKFIFPNYVDLKNLVLVDTNYKSRLIEWGQKNKQNLVFDVQETKSKKNKFCCSIVLNESEIAQGVGTSKKEAEQRAAEKAIAVVAKGMNNQDEI